MSNWALYSLDDGERICVRSYAASADSLKTLAVRAYKEWGYVFPFVIVSPLGVDTFRCDGETKTGRFKRWQWL